MDTDTLVKKLAEYFKECKDVSFAYLFGSFVKGTSHNESDVDIGVYFTPQTPALEYESETKYPNETRLWSDIENITKKQIDMVVLNRAPSILFDGVMREGIMLFSRDNSLLLRLSLAVGMAAQDFREFTEDFVRIRNRSKSLSQQDKDRLVRMIAFLENEISEYDQFKKISQQEYQSNRNIKRNFERWVENVVNAGIDIAKVLLASEKKMIPATYKDILVDLASLAGFDESMARRLGESAKMRNVLAHEYLDMRYELISSFMADADKIYAYLLKFANDKLNNKQ